MRVLGNLAERWGVQAIGVGVKDLRINVVAPGSTVNYPYLGLCAAAGSGAAELLYECERAGTQFDRWPAKGGAYDTVMRFVSAINGKRLAQEIVGEARNGWGGYLEWAYSVDNGWVRGPKAINIFFVGNVNADGHGVCDIYPRPLAYDPEGAIAAISTQGNVSIELESMVGMVDAESYIPPVDWTAWQPTWATATLALRLPDGTYTYRSKSYDMEDGTPVVFQLKDMGFEWGLQADELNRFLNSR